MLVLKYKAIVLHLLSDPNNTVVINIDPMEMRLPSSQSTGNALLGLGGQFIVHSCVYDLIRKWPLFTNGIIKLSLCLHGLTNFLLIQIGI